MDSANVLALLAQLGGGDVNNGVPPVTFHPIPAPGDDPYSLPPQPAAPPPQTLSNILQAVAPPQAPVAAQPAPVPPVAVEHPKKRMSAFDIIGRIADTIAT